MPVAVAVSAFGFIILYFFFFSYYTAVISYKLVNLFNVPHFILEHFLIYFYLFIFFLLLLLLTSFGIKFLYKLVHNVRVMSHLMSLINARISFFYLFIFIAFLFLNQSLHYEEINCLLRKKEGGR